MIGHAFMTAQLSGPLQVLLDHPRRDVPCGALTGEQKARTGQLSRIQNAAKRWSDSALFRFPGLGRLSPEFDMSCANILGAELNHGPHPFGAVIGNLGTAVAALWSSGAGSGHDFG
jgi:hypothetical protein